MFCWNCGKGLESSFAFCPNCGAKVEAERSLSSRDNIVGSASLTSQTSRKRASPSKPAAPAAKQLPTFRQFLDRKSEERRGHFKQTKKAKQGSCEATINVALMEYEGDVLKPVRGSSLPLKVEVSAKYNDVKDAAIKKRKAFDRTFNAERGYVLAYQDARIARQIPGSDQDFVLKSYKEWLGRSYSRLTLYLSPISKLEEVLDLDGGDIQESVFDEWSDCDVTLRALDEVEDLEYKEAILVDPPFPAAGHSGSMSVGADVPPRPVDGVLNSFVATDFLPIGLTESEAIDEAIKESLQQHEDDCQQPGPALFEEISEEQLIEDIKNHVSQHVNGLHRNIVVSRLSVWETAAPHLKRRKFADAKSLLEVTFTSFEAEEEDAIDLGGPRREFLHLLLGAICKDSKTLAGADFSPY